MSTLAIAVGYGVGFLSLAAFAVRMQPAGVKKPAVLAETKARAKTAAKKAA